MRSPQSDRGTKPQKRKIKERIVHSVSHRNHDDPRRLLPLPLFPRRALPHGTPHLPLPHLPPGPLRQAPQARMGAQPPAPLAWLLMESPTLWLTLLLFPHGLHSDNPKAQALIAIFLLHYFNRTILYPLRLLFTPSKKTASGFPLSVALMAFFFNLLNSYLQARSVSHYHTHYTSSGFFWFRFLIGLLVFLCGMGINVWADRVLLRLKSEGKGYVVPRGGLFDLVACPNYFGEIVEWLGWAVMTWSWAGLGFFFILLRTSGPGRVATGGGIWKSLGRIIRSKGRVLFHSCIDHSFLFLFLLHWNWECGMGSREKSLIILLCL
ncbi:hypothetical protein ACSQ67_016382 [Phaseolus vulgaris]